MARFITRLGGLAAVELNEPAMFVAFLYAPHMTGH